MSRPSRKKEIVLGAAFAGIVAALVYAHAGEVEVAHDLGAMKPAGNDAPEREVVREREREPVLEAEPVPKGEGKAVAPTPKRDWAAARARIRRALDAHTAAREASPRIDAPDEPQQTLDKKYIQHTVRTEVLPLVRECYNMLLDRDSEIAGRVVLQFTIMGDEAVGGIVEEVSFGEDSEIRDPSFRECLAETMRSTVFAPPEGGGRVVVKYPFVFENPEP